MCLIKAMGKTEQQYDVRDSNKPGNRLLVVLRQQGLLFKRIPLTLMMFIVTLVAGIATQTFARDAWPSLMEHFGWSLIALKQGRLYALWVGLIFSSTPGHFYSILAIGLLGVGALEYRYGTKWAAIGFLLIGPVSSILTTLILWSFDLFGVAWVKQSLYTPDMGSSSAALVCWGIFIGKGHGRWNRLLLWGTIIVLVLYLVFFPAVWDIDHIIAFLLGLFVGLIRIFKG
jgi:hypothetical protein